MIYRLFLTCSLLLVAHFSFAQKIDTAVYVHLLRADQTEFTAYAKSAGLNTRYDSASKTVFAKTKGIIFAKPLADNSNDFYVLTMMVSTLDKANNKLMRGDAEPVEGKKNTWADGSYLYIEWDTENPYTKEMWHKVVIYKAR